MKIYTTNTQHDDEFGLAKRVVITSFRQVSIFGKDYTKILYCHSPESFSVEKVGDNVDPNENVQVIMGPKAEEIITELINCEKKKRCDICLVWGALQESSRRMFAERNEERKLEV